MDLLPQRLYNKNMDKKHMRTKTRQNLAAAAAIGSLVAFALAPAGCRGSSGSGRKTITVKGSDTMVILGQRWAEEYMRLHPGLIVQITGGGSGTGIAALINGSTDIAQSSRSMKGKEKKLVQDKRGASVREIPVALDGVSVYVYEDNPIRDLSVTQLKAIYTARLTNWKQVGGPDAPIVLYGRENNSGTYMYFKEHVLENSDFAPRTQTLPGTAAVINAVSKDPHSIGYGGIAYASGVRILKVRASASAPPIEPSLDNVVSGKYPLSRHLYFYLAGEPKPEVQVFIDWVLGAQAQKICEKVGYYPLAKKKKASS